jgi:hypothetical protein
MEVWSALKANILEETNKRNCTDGLESVKVFENNLLVVSSGKFCLSQGAESTVFLSFFLCRARSKAKL